MTGNARSASAGTSHARDGGRDTPDERPGGERQEDKDGGHQAGDHGGLEPRERRETQRQAGQRVARRPPGDGESRGEPADRGQRRREREPDVEQDRRRDRHRDAGEHAGDRTAEAPGEDDGQGDDDDVGGQRRERQCAPVAGHRVEAAVEHRQERLRRRRQEGFEPQAGGEAVEVEDRDLAVERDRRGTEGASELEAHDEGEARERRRDHGNGPGRSHDRRRHWRPMVSECRPVGSVSPSVSRGRPDRPALRRSPRPAAGRRRRAPRR